MTIHRHPAAGRTDRRRLGRHASHRRGRDDHRGRPVGRRASLEPRGEHPPRPRSSSRPRVRWATSGNAAAGSGAYRGGSDDSGATFPFLDTDVYKWLEAVAWASVGAGVGVRRDRGAGRRGGRRGPAGGRLPGYLRPAHHGRAYRDLQWGHELYNIGHLLQAAIAWQRALGDDRLLRAATRAVDHVADAMGPGAVTRSTATRRSRWRSWSCSARRARSATWPWRDISSTSAGTGCWARALRAGLLAGPPAGARGADGRGPRRAPDVPRLRRGRRGDRDGRHGAPRCGAPALDDMTATRTYLTGALGSRHHGEAFGDPFELPPDRAYAETCAAIGSVMLAWRLRLATGEMRFADAIERALLNGVISGRSAGWTGVLLRQPAAGADRAGPATAVVAAKVRAPWYACACCPPNLMRLHRERWTRWRPRPGTRTLAHRPVRGRRAARIARGRRGALAHHHGPPWDGSSDIEVVATPDVAVVTGHPGAGLVDGGERGPLRPRRRDTAARGDGR